MAETGRPPPSPTTPAAGAAPAGSGVGWYFYDWANSAFSTTVITVFLGPFLTTVAETAAGCELGADSCDRYVHPLGITVAAGLVLPVPGLAVGVPAPCSCCR